MFYHYGTAFPRSFQDSSLWPRINDNLLDIERRTSIQGKFLPPTSDEDKAFDQIGQAAGIGYASLLGNEVSIRQKRNRQPGRVLP
jgi:hypothetical protein